jgi:hypothetical protein
MKTPSVSAAPPQSILIGDEKQFLAKKIALENEIQKRLVEQLAIRTQTQTSSPEQQALIEELYLDLKFINPELALNTLKAYASLRSAGIKLKMNKNMSQTPIIPASRQQLDQSLDSSFVSNVKQRLNSSQIISSCVANKTR